MKFKIILSFFVLLLSLNTTYASFPVIKKNPTNVEISNTSSPKSFSPAAFATDKSQGVAIILLLLLGFVAGHRWYLGSPWVINLFFIMTLGGLGIWALIDLIRIITKDLTPARGRYKRSFF